MKSYKSFLVCTFICLFLLSGCLSLNVGTKSRHNTYIPPSTGTTTDGTVPTETTKAPVEVVSTFEGTASWYGPKFHGKKTASGEIFDMYELTAAHKSLPMGTKCVVTNLTNGKSVIVRINDRGPFAKERVIDLSYASAKVIDMIHSGTIRVRVEVLSGEETDGLETVSGPAPIANTEVDTEPDTVIDTKSDTKNNNISGEYKVLFTIQVGSFSSRENAERLSDSIKEYVEDVWVEEFATTESVYYRVRAGKFSSREDAEKTATKLSEAGHTGFIMELK
jgi:peptidoglycan lytic transglycosylase